jgi:hypothetical protein
MAANDGPLLYALPVTIAVLVTQITRRSSVKKSGRRLPVNPSLCFPCSDQVEFHKPDGEATSHEGHHQSTLHIHAHLEDLSRILVLLVLLVLL